MRGTNVMTFIEVGRNINHSHNTILGIITKPINNLDCVENPFIIFCHGYNGNRVEDNRLTVKLSRSLAELGFMSFRFDFLGSGVSDGFFHEWTLNDRVSQVKTIKENLKNQIGFKKIVLVGLSDGCRVVLDACSSITDVTAAIIISPQLFNEDWKDDNKETGGLSNKLTLKRSRLHGKIMPCDDVGVWLHPRYLSNEGEYYMDIIEKLIYKIPILTVFGGSDNYVTATKNRFLNILSNLTINTIKNADHLYNSEEFMDELFNLIIKFLNVDLIKEDTIC